MKFHLPYSSFKEADFLQHFLRQKLPIDKNAPHPISNFLLRKSFWGKKKEKWIASVLFVCGAKRSLKNPFPHKIAALFFIIFILRNKYMRTLNCFLHINSVAKSRPRCSRNGTMPRRSFYVIRGGRFVRVATTAEQDIVVHLQQEWREKQMSCLCHWCE